MIIKLTLKSKSSQNDSEDSVSVFINTDHIRMLRRSKEREQTRIWMVGERHSMDVAERPVEIMDAHNARSLTTWSKDEIEKRLIVTSDEDMRRRAGPNALFMANDCAGPGSIVSIGVIAEVLARLLKETA